MVGPERDQEPLAFSSVEWKDVQILLPKKPGKASTERIARKPRIQPRETGLHRGKDGDKDMGL